MKKVASLLMIAILIAILLVFSLCRNLGAESWVEIISNGFGEPNNDYAWSMATFRGKIYVGTLNELNGAQIWSSSSGETDTWQKVYRSLPTTNMGVRCLFADGNQALYAGTYNASGAEILKTVDGRRWFTVARGGLGSLGNNSIRCMVRFGKYLYAGTGNSYPPPEGMIFQFSQVSIPSHRFLRNLFQTDEGRFYGAKLYRSTNGSRWERVKAEPGFESTRVFDPATNTSVINNALIGELAVFKDYIYAFTWTQDKTLLGTKSTPGAFEVWRSNDGVQWEKVVGQDDAYGNGMGFCLRDPDAGLENDGALSATVFKGRLYLGTANESCKSAVWRTSDGTQWEKVLDFFELGETLNLYVWRLIPFRDQLFVGTMNMAYVGIGGTGAQIWASSSGDVDSFRPVVHNGFDGEIFIMVTGERMESEVYKNYGIRTFGVLNDTLFAGTATIPSMLESRVDSGWIPDIVGRDIGCEIWKYVP